MASADIEVIQQFINLDEMHVQVILSKTSSKVGLLGQEIIYL